MNDDLSRDVNQAAREDVVIVLEQIARARQEIHAGLGIPFEQVRELPGIDVPRTGKAPGVKRSRRK